MDDPQDIANAFAATAKKVVTDSQKVITGAVKQINDNPGPPIGFTVGDALKTWTKLAKIALDGGIAMSQTALEIKPTPGVLILADHLTTIAAQAVSDTKTVADEVSDDIAAKTFDRDSAVHTAIKLSNIALLNGADAVQTVAAGPAQYASTTVTKKCSVAAFNANRVITVVKVALGGPASQPPIPGYRISLDPANGILPANATEFSIIINSAGLASGVYNAAINVVEPNSGLSTPVAVIITL